MEKLTLREIQLAELEILKAFDGVCQKHGLNYSLSSGTMLGAVRHGGFIPWDDDMDLEMPRPDYEKFIYLVESDQADLGNNLKLLSDRGNNAKYPWIKIIDESFKTEGSNLNDGCSGLFIDIFPLDGYPKSLDDSLKRHKKIQKYRRLLAYNYLTLNNFSGVEKVKRKIYSIYAKLHKPSNLVKKINSLSVSCPYEKSQFVGSAYFKSEKIIGAFTKDEIEDTTEISFEGCKFKAYKCYDKYLKLIYGDYMKIPEESERESHTFICYK